MKDNEFPNALRVIADKLENDFNRNIEDCGNDLYKIAHEVVMRFQELGGLSSQSFFNDIADFSDKLKGK